MKKENRKSYPSDLTDRQWKEIEALYTGMRKCKWSKRELTNAVLYLVDTGCKWRQLPHDFPPYSTVHSFYQRARINGLWNKILKYIVKKTRINAGRKESPSYAIIDSQSVKTTLASEERGIDGGKKRKEENDILWQTFWGVCFLLTGISTAKEAYTSYPSIQKFCADAGYRGTFVSDLKEKLGLGVDISEKIKPHQWEKLPWRWVVEHTFSWLNNSRRLSKDYEFFVSSSESMVIISHLHTLLKRL